MSARFEPGRVAAVLGPNGAGKTTLLGILSTLVSPSSGTVRWGDDPLGRGSPSRAHIGYVGHDPGLYVDLTARENLRFFCALHGCDATPARVDRLLARVGLADVPDDATARTFSRGMLQRLALARALAHDPALLLFDEPSAALDPAGAAWLQTELAAERAAGRTVVLVTHDLEATAAIADQVVILRRGPGHARRDAPRWFPGGLAARPLSGGDRWLNRRRRPPASSARRCASRPRICASNGAAARCSRP